MLPSYGAVAEALSQNGWRPQAVPVKRPTRKGLGRFAALSVLRGLEAEESDWPRWHELWFAARMAQLLMLDWFDVRLPSQTFWAWKLQVCLSLEDPGDRRDELAEKAFRWASR